MPRYAVNYTAAGLAREIEIDAASAAEAKREVYAEVRRHLTHVDDL